MCGSVESSLRGWEPKGFQPLPHHCGDAVTLLAGCFGVIGPMLQSPGSQTRSSRLLKERFHG